MDMFNVSESGWRLFKADSSAISFQVRYPSGQGAASFALTARDCPKKTLYKFFYGDSILTFEDVTKGENSRRHNHIPRLINREFQEFWLTWYNGAICLGLGGQVEPIFKYVDESITSNNIGYIRFNTWYWPGKVQWIFETSPVVCKPLVHKQFSDGQLRWRGMVDGRLPPDALIGGFEDEPVYIARAHHNSSSYPTLCVGKYVPSKNLAYVAWGHREHAKRSFEILCGYNAEWVKTRGNHIPKGAFPGGVCERGEPLYVGRALHADDLLPGKVHALHKACFLPYRGEEVKVYTFEILVSLDSTARNVAWPLEE